MNRVDSGAEARILAPAPAGGAQGGAGARALLDEALRSRSERGSRRRRGGGGVGGWLREGPSVAWACMGAALASAVWGLAWVERHVEARLEAEALGAALKGMGPAIEVAAGASRDPSDLAAKSRLSLTAEFATGRSSSWELGWGAWARVEPSAGQARALSFGLVHSGPQRPGQGASILWVSNLPPGLWRQTPQGVEVLAQAGGRALGVRLARVSPAGRLELSPSGGYECGGDHGRCAVAVTVAQSQGASAPPRPWHGPWGLALAWAPAALCRLWRGRSGPRARRALALLFPRWAARLPLALSRGRALGERL